MMMFSRQAVVLRRLEDQATGGEGCWVLGVLGGMGGMGQGDINHYCDMQFPKWMDGWRMWMMKDVDVGVGCGCGSCISVELLVQ